MSREIKFRAWDGERLRSVNTIGWVDGELDWIDTPKYNGPIDEDVKIMQYTGLKDKNGVEIYEGDIVNITRAGHRGMGGFGSVYYKEMRTTKIIGFSQQEAYGLDFSHADYKVTLKVIGNIYENPKMMEVNS